MLLASNATSEVFDLFLTRWVSHLQLNAVNDGDIVFMHQQSSTNRAAGRLIDYNRHYFTPGQSDRCLSLTTA